MTKVIVWQQSGSQPERRMIASAEPHEKEAPATRPGEGAQSQPRLVTIMRKKLVRRADREYSQQLRLGFQLAFLALNAWIGGAVLPVGALGGICRSLARSRSSGGRGRLAAYCRADAVQVRGDEWAAAAGASGSVFFVHGVSRDVVVAAQVILFVAVSGGNVFGVLGSWDASSFDGILCCRGGLIFRCAV